MTSGYPPRAPKTLAEAVRRLRATGLVDQVLEILARQREPGAELLSEAAAWLLSEKRGMRRGSLNA